MSKTPNYQSHKLIVLAPIRHLVGALAHLASWIVPTSWQTPLAKRITNTTSVLEPVVHKFLSYGTLHNALYMAQTEFEHVKELEHEALQQVEHKLHVMFAETDLWVPKVHQDDILNKFSNRGMKKCTIV